VKSVVSVTVEVVWVRVFAPPHCLGRVAGGDAIVARLRARTWLAFCEKAVRADGRGFFSEPQQSAGRLTHTKSKPELGRREDPAYTPGRPVGIWA